MCYKSPAKLLRSVKRMTKYIEQKPDLLSIEKLQPINIAPKIKVLSFFQSANVDIPPKHQNLSFTDVKTVSVLPKPSYHPAIIKACISMFDKKPDKLEPEEVNKFNHYRNYKLQNGEPIEEDIIYLPSSMRNCLHCDQPT